VNQEIYRISPSGFSITHTLLLLQLQDTVTSGLISDPAEFDQGDVDDPCRRGEHIPEDTRHDYPGDIIRLVQ
jgi:hypothetical protein